MRIFKDIDFSDLILNRNGNCYIKNLAGEKVGALIPISAEYESDLQTIRALLEKKTEKEFILEHDTIRYRVARSRDGSVCFLRKGSVKIPTLKENGFPDQLIKHLLFNQRSHGLLLISGKQGSGKTRTASSFIYERLNRFGGLAITIEDPPELPLHGEIGKGFCVQQEVGIDQVPAAIVESMRFASPDIIFLGELREGAVASEALRAAINGHLIVATVHASGVEETLERIAVLAKVFDGDAAYTLLNEGLFAVIHQTLEGQTLPRRLRLQFLFASDPVRSLIREQKIYQIGTEMNMQKNKILLGKGN